ncbi:hypothetical protein K1T71_011396 [Dendrolimus kikuchii]|uniref:Uncharacterized protein n=1 Tax=Dendrolimus kikuchii TaxID=765133 RepID=A0ACC1CNR1_9NEOP|nr:hypothetical protein K1T71_011396 [Dendrolimus kikuchii]
MSDELLLFEFVEFDNNDSSSQRQRRLKRRRLIRELSDPFVELDDTEFIQRYRLTKQLATELCNELRPKFKKAKKSTDLSVESKILTALSFYATGSYQRPVGDINAHSLAQQTVSSVIREVTRWCIDCTHIAIVRPVENEERFYSRKQYHSLNVQLVCDADMQITSVDVSYGGSTHDAFIWNAHPVKSHLEHINESTWLLGDSGYPLRKFLMTPIINAAPDTPESHYTDIHVRTRNIIERTIGLLKARFRCLLVHRVLHYKPGMAGSITNACVILHNICNKANISVTNLSNEDMLREAQLQIAVTEADSEGTSTNTQALQQGIAIRNALVHRLWDARRI